MLNEVHTKCKVTGLKQICTGTAAQHGLLLHAVRPTPFAFESGSILKGRAERQHVMLKGNVSPSGARLALKLRNLPLTYSSCRWLLLSSAHQWHNASWCVLAQRPMHQPKLAVMHADYCKQPVLRYDYWLQEAKVES